MSDHKNTISTSFPPMRVLENILGEEPAIVLVVNQDNQVIDYRIETLADVVAELSLNGFGQKIDVNQKL